MKSIPFILFMVLLEHLAAAIEPTRSPSSHFGIVVSLQARVGGGLRASIRDFCGMEELNFLWKKNDTSPWRGGQVKSKTEGRWIFEDPYVQLAPGEKIFFSCWITYRGKYFAKRNVEWVVPVLINEFELAEPPNLEDCPDEQTTKKPEDYQTTLLPDMSTAKSTEATRPNTSDQPIEPKPQDAQVPVEIKNDTKPDKPKNHNSSGSSKPPIFECAIRKPQSRESYQQSLERQLVKLQCDKMLLEEQAFLEKQAIGVELRDIIQLHDDFGERIKKLEMQLRSS